MVVTSEKEFRIRRGSERCFLESKKCVIHSALVHPAVESYSRDLQVCPSPQVPLRSKYSRYHRGSFIERAPIRRGHYNRNRVIVNGLRESILARPKFI